MRRLQAFALILILGGSCAAWAGNFLTFEDGQTTDPFTPPTVVKGAPNQQIGRCNIKMDGGDFFKGATIRFDGARTGVTSFTLWFSNDNLFDGGDTPLANVNADPGDGNSIHFDSFSQPMTIGVKYWVFVTADVAINATGQI